ncbi:MAG: hypothetical protein ACK57O_01945 [Planctomyces sp.]|jgi:DNA-directed RNA polymerase specialized sigma54-like protein
MDELHWEQPAMLFRLEILQMTVAELSSELLRTAIQTPEVRFRSHESGVVVSSEVDVVVSFTPEDTRAQIAEPGCGDPFLIPMASGASPGLRLCQILLESIDVRRSTLQKVTDALIEHLPNFPQTRDSIKLSELARQCEMHITTVSRALDNKTCSTPVGPVALRRYISGMI